jgi:2-polyprenyl-6-methoxyphenol hydroxylase-like FAD-dependent oxidoreductase
MATHRAVVLGASIAGMLAARVLADFYDEVTVVDRDALPDTIQPRRGVPQGRHIHGLLSAGSETLQTFFPGILDEMVAAGAVAFDFTDPAAAWVHYSGHDVRCTEPTASVASYSSTRPFLEAHIRRRLRALPSVTVRDEHDVVDLLSDNAHRVTGVRVCDRRAEAELSIDADLVVDAMGRGARTPAVLEQLGYGRPAEEETTVRLAYVSQLLRIPAGALTECLVLSGPTPTEAAGMAMARVEGGRWILTVGGMAGEEPPTDGRALLRYAADLVPAHVAAVLDTAVLLGETTTFRYPASRRRHYDRMRRFPSGLLVIGDAMCSFNPIYGQGMTVAALEAIALRDCLRDGDLRLSERFFRSAAKVVDVAWQMANGSDLAHAGIVGRRTAMTRLSGRYTQQLLKTAAVNGTVAEQLLRVLNMVDPPSKLMAPQIALRTARIALRRPNARPQSGLAAGGSPPKSSSSPLL